MLDGIPVQRSLSASIPDIDDNMKLPTLKPGFYGSDEQRALIEAFIIEYITVYDDDDVNNRKNLINAYDENATFTLSAENLPDSNERRPFTYFSFSTYNTYRKSSHNVMCVEKWERFREKVVHKGAMDIIVMLRKLPATKHLMDTFVVDVSMTTAKHMCFAVHGFFRDSMTKVQDDDEVKFFCRNFVVVNKGEGKIAVLSDILFVSGVFTERIQRYKSMITSLLKAAPDTGTSMNMDGAGGSMSVGDGAENRWMAEPLPPAPQLRAEYFWLYETRSLRKRFNNRISVFAESLFHLYFQSFSARSVTRS
ncbi:unnamed protein product [Gongylonema pulchrum]|uniref:NTF2 domain-containing protein n=1 Tax=Gongylonema pulchrum TaxID=637853 RepID=A0A183DSR0_9BILA|nr:unnamed protein product [Gongylonema pulchrum]